ncbi:probable DNA-3-methyladenine glycosylase [Penaeus monodon]|uniref:probable DNA-3-methyladenine glycosylase n=1 Tax=Penaeus monodon TaxID=6687 RepID=UPI0018A7A6E3|nr:probable DNA-3-methyladenine glycosylase [Penaeus monodon]
MSKRLRKLSNHHTKVMRTDLSLATSDPTVSPYFTSSNDADDDESSCSTTGESRDNQSTADSVCNLDPDETTSKNHQPSLQQSQVAASSMLPGRRLTYSFYNQECVTLAKALLGQVMVRMIDGVRVSGVIVETESYLGGEDVASHSHNNKRTPRNEPMYMKPGTSYVYPIYGMYYCFNVSSQGDGSCVLVRALEPLEGMAIMAVGRNQRRKNTTPLKTHQLCNGPSKLCQALDMTKDSCNKLDLATSNVLWLEAGTSIPESQVVIGKRIGIESAGEEWANKPLRFYVADNKFVSVFEKKKANQSLAS